MDRRPAQAPSAPSEPGLTRRQMLAGTITLMAGALALPTLAGCSGGATAKPSALKFWHPLSGGDGITMSTLVENINAAQGFDTRQTVLTWGTPYYTKLAMASAGGRAPDIAIMHASRIPGYAPGGLLDAWDTDLLAEFDVTEADFPEAVWKKGFIGDDLFSIALDSHPFIMLYNLDIAASAGALGEDGLLQEITSPEQFLDVAARMQAVTGKHGVSYGYLGDGAQMWRLFSTFYAQMGATMDLTGDEVVMDTEAGIATLEFIRQLLDGVITARTGDYGTAIAEFLNQETGLFLTGVWELPTMKEAGIAFDARTIPNLFGTEAVYGDSHAFVLPNQSSPDPERRRETYRFVSQILKDSFAWAGAGHIPAYQPIIDDPAYADLLPQAHYADAAEYLVYDPEVWFSGSGSDFQSYFMENVQSVFLGETDPATGLDAFVRRLNSLLAKPNPVTGA